MADIRTLLKSYFRTGEYPTAEQFAELIDAFLTSGDEIAMDKVRGLIIALAGKYDKTSAATLEAGVTNNAAAITSEISRAKTAEQKNAADITTETSRAKTAEQKNAAAITAEAITREQAVAGMADKRLDNTGYADMLRNINGHIGTCTYNAGNPYATNPGMYIMYDGKEYKGLLFVSSNGMPTYQHVITPDGIKYRRWNNSGQMGGNWSPIWATRIDFANAGGGSSGGISATVDGWQLNISSGAIVIGDALILTAYAPIYRNNLILTT